MKPATAAKLHTTSTEFALIAQIVGRASEILGNANGEPITGAQRMSMHLDIAACHLNGNPLRLAEMLNASDMDLAHDICGIVRHLDRATGKLGGCFAPRFSERENA